MPKAQNFKYKYVTVPLYWQRSTSYLSDKTDILHYKISRVRKDHTHLFVKLLLGISICIFCFIIYLLWFPDLLNGKYPLNLLKLQTSPEYETRYGKPEPVSSYLTYMERRRVFEDLQSLIKKTKESLRVVEEEMARLEDERESFYKNLDSRDRLFNEVVSVFDLNRPEENQKLGNPRSLFLLFKNSVEFKTEEKRRIKKYEALYKQRYGELLREKKALIKKLESLSGLIEAASDSNKAKYEIAPGSFFINRIKREYTQRLIFLIEHDDYGKAIETIEKMLQLSYQADEQASKIILLKMLSVLEEYTARIDYLKRQAPFEDLKFSYLNEDYRNALWKLNLLEKKEYLRPMLTALRGTLYSNIKQVEEIEKEVEARKRMKELNRKAELFEQKDEYRRAIEIYEEFLTYHLSPYDREYLIKKLQSLRLAYEMDRIRREQNSKALKLLSDAGAFAEKGNRREAIELYTRILKECPNSDHIEKAVSGILSLASARDQTVRFVQTQ